MYPSVAGDHTTPALRAGDVAVRVKSSAAGSVNCAELTGVRLLELVMPVPVPVTPMLLMMLVVETVPPKVLATFVSVPEVLLEILLP